MEKTEWCAHLLLINNTERKLKFNYQYVFTVQTEKKIE